eukprot:TRINITY_DN42319_c0_g1_i1.p1 TRINITY_DN42319_c0_g1~~TRINITY_DN42319_c0_g1_i1.p1  ORF type:complete len:434 (+),score=70.73 TRINITY_DN42319_c0_g1_i1:100-1401(+)
MEEPDAKSQQIPSPDNWFSTANATNSKLRSQNEELRRLVEQARTLKEQASQINGRAVSPSLFEDIHRLQNEQIEIQEKADKVTSRPGTACLMTPSRNTLQAWTSRPQSAASTSVSCQQDWGSSWKPGSLERADATWRTPQRSLDKGASAREALIDDPDDDAEIEILDVGRILPERQGKAEVLNLEEEPRWEQTSHPKDITNRKALWRDDSGKLKSGNPLMEVASVMSSPDPTRPLQSRGSSRAGLLQTSHSMPAFPGDVMPPARTFGASSPPCPPTPPMSDGSWKRRPGSQGRDVQGSPPQPSSSISASPEDNRRLHFSSSSRMQGSLSAQSLPTTDTFGLRSSPESSWRRKDHFDFSSPLAGGRIGTPNKRAGTPIRTSTPLRSGTPESGRRLASSGSLRSINQSSSANSLFCDKLPSISGRCSTPLDSGYR